MLGRRVFISHSTRDASVANRILETLERAGISCWIAPRDIEPGSDWSASITPAINEADLVVLVFSTNANASQQVVREVHLSQSGKVKPILPVRIEPVEPEGALRYLLAGVHWLDAVDRIDLALAELLDATRRTLLPKTSGEDGRHKPGRGAEAAFGNLPRELTELVGRQREIEEIEMALQRHNIVTIVGTGGVGKTRLANRIAHRRQNAFEGGAWFVDLSPLRDPALIGSTVAHMLGVSESAGGTLDEHLAHELAARNVLLLLDNCEHLIDGVASLAATVAQNIGTSSQTRILCTTRQPLGVKSEFVSRLHPLAVPPERRQGPTLAELDTFPAARLFLDRAGGNVACDTPSARIALASICRRLDGIPLAIELAAARTTLLSIEQIASALEQRFRLLSKGDRESPPRQQTLEALISWSYDLLDPKTAALFRRLGVLSGSFSLPAVLALAAESDRFDVIDQLEQLSDHSLLATQGVRDGVQRYQLLESLREFAAMQLRNCGESDLARTLLIEYVRAVANAAGQGAAGIAQIEAEIDNLRTVLGIALEEPVDVELSVDLLSATSGYWLSAGRFTEGRRWYEVCLTRASPPNPHERAGFQLSAAALAIYREDYTAACELAEAALALCGQSDVRLRARAMNTAASAKYSMGDVDAAAKMWRDALALLEDTGDTISAARVRNNLATLEWQAYDRLDAARELYEITNHALAAAGDELGVAFNLGSLAEIAYAGGRPNESIQCARKSLAIYERLGNESYIADRHLLLAKYHLAKGEALRGVDHIQTALRSFVEADQPVEIAESLLLVAEAIGPINAGSAWKLLNFALRQREAAKRPILKADRTRIESLAMKLEVQVDKQGRAAVIEDLDAAVTFALALLTECFP